MYWLKSILCSASVMLILFMLCGLLTLGVNSAIPVKSMAQTSRFLCKNLTLDDLRNAGIVDIQQTVYPNPAECMYISPADYMTVTVLRNTVRSTVIRGLRLFHIDGSPMYMMKRVLRCNAYFLLENIVIITESSYCGVSASLMAYIEQHKL